MQEFIKINFNDSVAVALKHLEKGRTLNVEGQEVTLLEEIPQAHKFALQNLAAGDKVYKYGFPIGIAKTDIPRGTWIHTHNLKTNLGDLLEYTYEKDIVPIPPTEDVTFMGYRRADGKVGVRNEIWIIPTVGCVNNVAQMIEKKAKKYAVGTVEDICAFPHPYGCSQMGDDPHHFMFTTF